MLRKLNSLPLRAFETFSFFAQAGKRAPEAKPLVLNRQSEHHRTMTFCGCLASLLLAAAVPISAAVYNLKVVTDASPDYSDMESMVRSITSRWETPEEKCWAMFYW